MKIAIIDYAAGNVQSIKFALERIGYQGFLTADPDEIFCSDKVIFPGVGEAETAMNRLRERRLDQLIPTLKQPVLGICLGMQLLCKDSEEGQTKALGIFDVSVKRFSNQVKIPQVGWNNIQDFKGGLFGNIPENEFVYLVHSYFAPICNDTIATAHYDAEYSAALQKDNFFGVQFHPEKSGKMGEKILQNFLNL